MPSWLLLHGIPGKAGDWMDGTMFLYTWQKCPKELSPDSVLEFLGLLQSRFYLPGPLCSTPKGKPSLQLYSWKHQWATNLWSETVGSHTIPFLDYPKEVEEMLTWLPCLKIDVLTSFNLLENKFKLEQLMTSKKHERVLSKENISKIYIYIFQAQHRAQCGAWTHDTEIKTWAEVKSQPLNQLSHPGTPTSKNL